MEALRVAKLYVNKKKCKLFCEEVKFLGHKISARGIEADDDKVARILEWPQPKSAQDVRRFLGLTRYLVAFLPRLAEFSNILSSNLATKECDKVFPAWSQKYEDAFQAIKDIVTSRDCLTVINHDMLDTHNIYVTTDASHTVSGAVLSFGKTWESA